MREAHELTGLSSFNGSHLTGFVSSHVLDLLDESYVSLQGPVK